MIADALVNSLAKSDIFSILAKAKNKAAMDEHPEEASIVHERPEEASIVQVHPMKTIKNVQLRAQKNHFDYLEREEQRKAQAQKNREAYWEREDRRQRQLEHIIDFQERWHAIEKNIMAEQMIESTKNMLKRKNENKLRASKGLPEKIKKTNANAIEVDPKEIVKRMRAHVLNSLELQNPTKGRYERNLQRVVEDYSTVLYRLEKEIKQTQKKIKDKSKKLKKGTGNSKTSFHQEKPSKRET